MSEEIKKLENDATVELKKVKDLHGLEAFRIAYLGRKGRIPLFLRSVAELPLAKRKEAGMAGNALRGALEARVLKLEKELGRKFSFIKAPKGVGLRAGRSFNKGLDVTRPGKRIELGHAHILSNTLKDIRDIFVRMGFAAVLGPEIESEWYNFDALNIPEDHPAREMQDTFWLKQTADTKKQKTNNKERLLMRTHISGIQVRYMEKNQPPFRIYYEGRAFRRDATDATHETQFHQMEILYVDKKLSVANFKAIIEQFLKAFFKKDIRVRLRPAYFPFVEPGFEIDMTCVRCGGKKCTLCTTGWLEIAGAGMVHQNVFRAAGYIPGEWQGIAFSFGVERLAMLKHRIPDIRLFFGGDLRFIEQF
ncbi:MAG: phenylalanine--tRNA ligase subunit alpha [bacterium]|nr:phenylalanine--tRNA ligase subunit alpha [bacterium]